MKRTRYACQMSTKRQFSWQTFRKILPSNWGARWRSG